MQQPRTTYITIHCFALLHVLAAFILRVWVGRDDVILTMLTIAMVIFICRQWLRPLWFAMSMAVVACFAGYYIGDLGAGAMLAQWGVARNMIATFFVTEIIGWITYLTVRQNNITLPKISVSELRLSTLFLPHIIFLTAITFLFRTLLTSLLETSARIMSLSEFMTLTIGNVPLTISILWANIAAARLFSRISWFTNHVILRFCAEYTYLVLISFIGAFIVHFAATGMLTIRLFSNQEFLIRFFSILTLSTTVYYVTNIILYFRSKQQAELREQIHNRKKAAYQYGRLKQQLNPHFLFNSLNVLDHLVLTDPKRASSFIQKLAGVYRYQLNQEQKMTVPLDEEIAFVNAYYDLLRERFGDALKIAINIDDNTRKTYRIVPCALQLLVENAVKHNTLSTTKPLTIKLLSQEQSLIVTNNIQPKITPATHSWGIGLKSIKEQYNALCKQEVVIQKTDLEFIVELPLIKT